MDATPSRRKLAGRLVTVLVVVVVLALVVARFTILSYWTTPHNGMYPNLSAGARFFGLNDPYGTVADVKRGEIVVFEDFQGEARYIYIWRVVGLPGDRVEFEDARLSINGRALPLEKVRSEGRHDIYRETNGVERYEIAIDRAGTQPGLKTFEATVPEGEVFVAGDNRSHASDSRIRGPIAFRRILARRL